MYFASPYQFQLTYPSGTGMEFARPEFQRTYILADIV